MITCYTDGSSKKNNQDSPAGWAVCIEKSDGSYYDISDSMRGTANRAEATALLQALLYVKEEYPGHPVTVKTDSKYVCDSFNSWAESWIRNGTIQTRANSDLWMEIINLKKSMEAKTVWVKGHASCSGNRRADKLAGVVCGLKKKPAARKKRKKVEPLQNQIIKMNGIWYLRLTPTQVKSMGLLQKEIDANKQVTEEEEEE